MTIMSKRRMDEALLVVWGAFYEISMLSLVNTCGIRPSQKYVNTIQTTLLSFSAENQPKVRALQQDDAPI